MILKGFEEALEIQDEELIARHRSVLQEYVDRFDFREEEEEDDSSPGQTDGW
jgi:hypothetical protein